jgi:hypothetical protein
MIPKLQQINLLRNKNSDIEKGIEWIKNYHKVLKPQSKNRSNILWYIPSESEGILTIKKRLLSLNSIYDRMKRDEYSLKVNLETGNRVFVNNPNNELIKRHNELINQIKYKISDLNINHQKEYYELNQKYIKTNELNKELELRNKELTRQLYKCRNENHLIKIELNKNGRYR